MHYFTFWTLVISRINRACFYKGHDDSVCQLNVDLAHLVEHWLMVQRSWVQSPLGKILTKNFCFSLCNDNLTETLIVKN